MRALIALTLLLPTGCSDPVADAEEELRIVLASHPTHSDECRARKHLAAAVLKAHDAKRFAELSRLADIECKSAQVDRDFGGVP